jgi:hypothetical protein
VSADQQTRRQRDDRRGELQRESDHITSRPESEDRLPPAVAGCPVDRGGVLDEHEIRMDLLSGDVCKESKRCEELSALPGSGKRWEWRNQILECQKIRKRELAAATNGISHIRDLLSLSRSSEGGRSAA